MVAHVDVDCRLVVLVIVVVPLHWLELWFVHMGMLKSVVLMYLVVW